ncbi:hypothetical protein RDI58_010752 [Solanum bulbocastanum]|uniref:Uncharacterized protein n=1 Tax=Solanum bulbocastanum TaxID=147425 RepID=A0AAN8TU66_SOLBU
MLEVVRTELP